MTDAHHVKVYIRDQAYAWLPASIVFIKEGQAFVRIELPHDWHSSTMLCQDSGLEEIEDALMAFNNSNSSSIGNGEDADPKKQPNAFRNVPLTAYPNNQLPLRNKGGHKDDMTELPHLHEAAMLYNLKERSAMGKPYTRVRDLIVAMNPFQRIDKLYSLETQVLYAKKLLWAEDEMGALATIHEEEKKDDVMTPPQFRSPSEQGLEPHIYEVSCMAFRGLALENRDQSIVVTGEAGSGKTETVKILLQHLATLELQQPQCNMNVVDKILRSSSVLEAFGNAQTRRNNNSSRFGNFVQLQYTVDALPSGHVGLPPCTLVGSVITNYLVEKTRVVSRAVGERSFHIFYQLLSAPEGFKRDLWPFFATCKPTDFSYLAQHGEFDIDDLNDEETWQSTVNALAAFHIQGELLRALMRALAIILQLGNLRFDQGFSDDGERMTIVRTEKELDRLSEMMGIEKSKLEMSLTSRAIKTNFEELRSYHPPAYAKEATDALAKELYDRLFKFIVQQINLHTKPTDEDDVCGCISLVDIYGFERLAVNRFEQLCINYANEQLQQKYVADNFRLLKEEYDQEGIDIFDFSLVDNSDVLNLLDGRTGVFVALQEECTRAMGNDESFVAKVKKENSSHSRLISQQLHTKMEFGIRHFAGPVTYDATKFVERNMDKTCDELLVCSSESSNSLIRKELQSFSTKTPNRRMNLTLIEKFTLELRDLMVAMEETQCSYIRCIIPNHTMSPGVTDHLMTLRQLEYAGMMTSVALTRESLPDRLPYKELLSRYGRLLKESDREQMKELALQDQIVYLLTTLFRPILHNEDGDMASMPFACGTTKAYMRTGALDHLEALRYRFFWQRAALIQRIVRRVQAEGRYRRIRTNFVHVQAISRAWLARRGQQRLHAASRRISSWLRQQIAATVEVKYQLRHSAAIIVQTKWRAVTCAEKYRSFVGALIVLQKRYRQLEGPVQSQLASVVIQSKWRSSDALKKYRKFRRAVVLLQRQWRQGESFMRRVHAAAVVIQSRWRKVQLERQQKIGLLLLSEQKDHAAIMVQSQWRSCCALRKYRRIRNTIRAFQRTFRQVSEVKHRVQRDQHEQQAAKAIQAVLLQRQRKKHSLLLAKQKHHAAIVVQSRWRTCCALRKYRRIRNTIRAFQRTFRHIVANKHHEHHAAKTIQLSWRAASEAASCERLRGASFDAQESSALQSRREEPGNFTQAGISGLEQSLAEHRASSPTSRSDDQFLFDGSNLLLDPIDSGRGLALTQTLETLDDKHSQEEKQIEFSPKQECDGSCTAAEKMLREIQEAAEKSKLEANGLKEENIALVLEFKQQTQRLEELSTALVSFKESYTREKDIEMREQVAALQSQNEAAEQARSAEIQTLRNLLDEVEEEHNAKIERLQREVEHAEMRREKVEQDEAEHRNDVQTLLALLDEKENEHLEEVKKLVNELQLAQHQRAEAETSMNGLQAANMQELQDLKSQIKVYSTENASLKARVQQQDEKENEHLEEVKNLVNELQLAQHHREEAEKGMHGLQATHIHELHDLKSEIKGYCTEIASLQEKVQQQDEKEKEHLGQLDKLRDDLQLVQGRHKETVAELNGVKAANLQVNGYQTEIASLQEKNKRQEENARAEKAELCNMLKEVEDHFAEDIRNLKEEVLREKEVQTKLKDEKQSLEVMHKKEILGLKRKLLNEFKTKSEQHDAAEAELKTRIESQTVENEHLKSEIQKLQAASKEEEEKRKTVVDSPEKDAELLELREEMRQLREELFWAQETKRQLESEISEMEASHEEEMNKLKQEALGGTFDYKEEAANLKEKIARQEQNTREEKEELCKMLKATEETHLAEMRNLETELSIAKESHRELKSEMQKLQATHAEELGKMMNKTLDYSTKGAEIESLQNVIKKQEGYIQEEKARLRGMLKGHFEGVRELKQEFVEEQAAHMDHLACVVECLETISAQRKEEMTLLMEELDAVKGENDVVFENLSREQSMKCPTLSLGLPTIEEASEIPSSEVNDLRARLAQNSSLRFAQSKEFSITLTKLQRAVKPENMKYIIDKISKKGGSEVQEKVFGEIHRMSVALGELFQMEESSQKMVDDSISNFLETLSPTSDSSDSGPELESGSRAGHEEDVQENPVGTGKAKPGKVLEELQHRMDAIEKQNAALKKHLKAKNTSRRTKTQMSPVASPPDPEPSISPMRRRRTTRRNKW